MFFDGIAGRARNRHPLRRTPNCLLFLVAIVLSGVSPYTPRGRCANPCPASLARAMARTRSVLRSFRYVSLLLLGVCQTGKPEPSQFAATRLAFISGGAGSVSPCRRIDGASERGRNFPSKATRRAPFRLPGRSQKSARIRRRVDRACRRGRLRRKPYDLFRAHYPLQVDREPAPAGLNRQFALCRELCRLPRLAELAPPHEADYIIALSHPLRVAGIAPCS